MPDGGRGVKKNSVALEVAAESKALLLVSVSSSPCKLLTAVGDVPHKLSPRRGDGDRHAAFAFDAVETGLLEAATLALTAAEAAAAAAVAAPAAAAAAAVAAPSSRLARLTPSAPAASSTGQRDRGCRWVAMAKVGLPEAALPKRGL